MFFRPPNCDNSGRLLISDHEKESDEDDPSEADRDAMEARSTFWSTSGKTMFGRGLWMSRDKQISTVSGRIARERHRLGFRDRQS